MKASYLFLPRVPVRPQTPGCSKMLDNQNTIRRLPAGAHLTPKLLGRENVVLSGWVGLGRPRNTVGNLIGVLLPGDAIGAVLEGQLCSAVALTPVSVTLDEDGAEGMREMRHLIRQCVRTCHLSAPDRIEDFFLETYDRLEAEGLASDCTFDLPISQAVLGNILGISAAHVNRVIKQLQAASRIRLLGRAVTLLDPSSFGASAQQDSAV